MLFPCRPAAAGFRRIFSDTLMSNAAAAAKQITLKTPSEIEILLQANRIVGAALNMLRERAGAGVSTWELDQWAEEFARQHGVKIPMLK